MTFQRYAYLLDWYGWTLQIMQRRVVQFNRAGRARAILVLDRPLLTWARDD